MQRASKSCKSRANKTASLSVFRLETYHVSILLLITSSKFYVAENHVIFFLYIHLVAPDLKELKKTASQVALF